jgi:hypothetical protein
LPFRAVGVGWHDITAKAAGEPAFSRQFAGHLENGKPNVTG